MECPGRGWETNQPSGKTVMRITEQLKLVWGMGTVMHALQHDHCGGTTGRLRECPVLPWLLQGRPPDMGPHADMEVDPTDECQKQFYQLKVKRGKKTVKFHRRAESRAKSSGRGKV